MSVTEMFDGVTLTTRANVYFDGKCVSHGFVLPDGARKSVGVVLPGRLTFGTAAPEIMECVAGGCRVRMAAETDWRSVVAGESFAVPADSSFEIEVVGESFHYICHYG